LQKAHDLRLNGFPGPPTRPGRDPASLLLGLAFFAAMKRAYRCGRVGRLGDSSDAI